MTDPAKLDSLVSRLVDELGGAASVALVRIGDQLGLYTALQKQPMNSHELAQAAGIAERYAREWLAQQAASGYIAYDEASGKFALSPEQAMIFAEEDSPFYMMGAFDAIAANLEGQAKVQAAFRTGAGVEWGAHSACLFCAVARFLRPGYRSNLVSSWLPALDGMVERLQAGARVADVGCGHGVSTALMAAAFPQSEFVGFDFHIGSVEAARRHAADHRVGNIRFEVATAKTFPGTDYDLVTFFDCLHDMGDPIGAAAHVRRSLNPNGTWMIVEPQAGDTLAENLNPVGRLWYAASTMVCVPTSLSQEVGLALGAQAGEKRLREVLSEGGFTRVRRAADTPVNMVLEARP
ncbi:MAG: methyltransferase domain-containing protein [Alphaproteobacteria bacterium]|nr:methyltransferase domain-containing protein [Alphaproteobacteria bacterium]